MGVNKVVYGGRTVVDLTDATATADTVLAGYTAYGADGSRIVGTASAGTSLTVSAPAGATVTVTKDSVTKTKTAGSDGEAVFGGMDDGTWEITISDGIRQYSRSVKVSANYRETMEFFTGYLYKDGNEYPGITGGWCGDEDFLMKEEQCLSMMVYDGECAAYLRTLLPFDCTDYSQMTLHCAFGAYAYGDALTFGVMTENFTTIASVTKEYEGETEVDYADLELDIQEVFEICYPFIKVQTSEETMGVMVSVASLRVE